MTFDMNRVFSKLIQRGGVVAHIRESVLIVGTYFVYLFLRRTVGSNAEDSAWANAEWIINLEKKLGFFWEPFWHQWAVQTSEWIIIAFNWIYIVTFFPIVLITALVYYLFDRERYFYYRSIILLSFGISLIIFCLFPLTPPRMMGEYNFVNTFVIYGPSWYAGEDMVGYYNAFAAMPSLHFAWTMIFGVLFFKHGSLVFKCIGVLYPSLTLLAITITANHYISDAIVGAVVMLVAYALYEKLVHYKIPMKIWHLISGGNAE
ncbi:phosphatase PAP2 family protein [SAR202 cluster bacterium AD-804-J14_MRT_500m]|nr:phosphatase PAP2 family protein [SAR202 cluster bacterium AD-804-J14_MRT_500m]